MAGILEGLRVIDMGHFVAVPAAGAVLADWGAEVIKVEPLRGDAQRSSQRMVRKTSGVDVHWRFEVHNRNKKSMAIDLTTGKGREVLYRLVERSDVFMSNYEAAAVRKLGMDYETLRGVNPALVYALVTGYGTVGPDKDERGFDFAAAWARSGIQHSITEPNCPPPQQRGGMMDRTTGFHMIAGIMAALWHRERSGEGQELELSLYHSGVWTLAADLQVALGGGRLNRSDRSRVVNPLWNSYRTQDGQWLQLAMLQADLSWGDFCRAIEHPELEHDPRYRDIEARADHSEELIGILDVTFSSRNRADWEQRLRENNCIYGRIASAEDVINDPQAEANRFFVDLQHPRAGEVKYVASPVRFRQNPASLRTTAPELGQHTEELLLELGYDWGEIVEMKDARAII